MKRLLLFNPENDIALAAATANFTPPLAARQLRDAGAMLPMWYADGGDKVLAAGVNARWLDTMRERFGIDVDVMSDAMGADLQPSPWGWSLAVRRRFADAGVAERLLPSDEKIECWRQLSHRRTASQLCLRLAQNLDFEIAQPAVEIADADVLRLYLQGQPESIVKSPWSSSGRGLIDCRTLSDAEVIRRCEGVIRRQGSVMVERAYERVSDFAMLFRCAEGRCSYQGLSVFDTDAGGNYCGNLLADESILRSRLGALYPLDRLDAVAAELEVLITEMIACDYDGPLGVDMLLARTSEGLLLDATVELNLRMTMGFVAHELSNRYLADGRVGRYRVERGFCDATADTMMVDDHKMTTGRMNLTPPGGMFSFVVEV